MKKIRYLVVCLLAMLWLPQTVNAEGCLISAGDPIQTLPGKTITVPVEISGNPGFTNFGIGLEYDSQQLQLLDIQTVKDNQPFLCGTNVRTNISWETSQKQKMAYITAASATAVTEQGILFTATFSVPEDFSGSATVTPVVYYLRNNRDPSKFPSFASVQTGTAGTTVTAIIRGDVNMDGTIEYDDVMLAYKALQNPEILTQQQIEIADMNRSQGLEETDAKAIYQIYLGGS